MLFYNFIFILINFIENNMTEKAVDYFLAALIVQKTYTDIHKGFGQGIMRLVLTVCVIYFLNYFIYDMHCKIFLFNYYFILFLTLIVQ